MGRMMTQVRVEKLSPLTHAFRTCPLLCQAGPRKSSQECDSPVYLVQNRNEHKENNEMLVDLRVTAQRFNVPDFFFAGHILFFSTVQLDFVSGGISEPTQVFLAMGDVASAFPGDPVLTSLTVWPEPLLSGLLILAP